MANGGVQAGCDQVCAPGKAGGCLRCGTVPEAKGGAKGGAKSGCSAQTLLLAAQDADAAATLEGVLAGTGFEVSVIGPVSVVKGVRGRLSELGKILSEQLTQYTRSCIRAAVAPAGGDTVEGALSAFVFAEPLDALLKKLQHEWARTALTEGWLTSVFHPIVDARTKQVFAQEALIRARDPESGKMFGAGQIIDACAALNLQHQLDQLARKSAIRGAAEHVTGGVKVFVNFLPNTIYDPEICLRTTMEAARENNVALDRLVFEVVETEQIPDMRRLRTILEYYRARGVGTAVDDMGAGYTSVEYIAALEPNYVKLDRELMVEAEHNLIMRRKMDLMIATSHAHDARVIAEGIETEGQLAMCEEAGVDFVQGFYFAKPACPPQEIRRVEAVRRAA